MAYLVLLVGAFICLAILSTLPRLPKPAWRVAVALSAAILFVGFVILSSIRYVSPSEVGIVEKNALGDKLTAGRVVATEGEMGIQADVLRPGWQFWFWPVIFNVESVALTEVRVSEVGLVEAIDGLPLITGEVYAAELPAEAFQRMVLDARYFLTDGKGQKGPQVNVLTPGKYPINTRLFRVQNVPQTDVKAGTVAVLKANFGKPATLSVPLEHGGAVTLANEGEKGVRSEPLLPGKYPLNPNAFEVVTISTMDTIVHYTAEQLHGRTGEESAITVITSDGFTFPVDVRVEYKILPDDAPILVARMGGEGNQLRSKLDSAVRAIFRNNAESVKALDYVQQRSHQETQSLAMLLREMSSVGVTVTAVRIGRVGDEASLGALLKTQMDREIAKQEQLTFQEQQKAAEQKQLLSRAIQEAEEEKRLATAAYSVKIAEEEQRRILIEAGAQAKAVSIRAEAQAGAFKLIAEQLGKSNAALLELLKVIGENNVQITPRVMVLGSDRDGSGRDPETAALIGTMLDTMITRDEAKGP